jgi:transposase
MTEYFNYDHYMAVRCARKKQGLPIELTNIKVDHELVGKKLLKNKEEFTIQSVHQHWYRGWYLVLLVYDKNRSHTPIIWDNICCHDPLILNVIEENKNNIKVL